MVTIMTLAMSKAAPLKGRRCKAASVSARGTCTVYCQGDLTVVFGNNLRFSQVAKLYGLFTGLKPRATYFQARRWAYNPPDLTFTVVLDFVSSESGEIV